MEDYSLDSLSKTFSSHADTADQEFEKAVISFKKINPDIDLPDHMKENFNLARALSVICKELIRLGSICNG